MTYLQRIVGVRAVAGPSRPWAAAFALPVLLGIALTMGCATPTPDRILFTSDRNGNQDIYAIDPNGEELTLLTSRSEQRVSTPVVSGPETHPVPVRPVRQDLPLHHGARMIPIQWSWWIR